MCEKTSGLLIQGFGELLLFWACVTIPRGSGDGGELVILILVSVLLCVKYVIVLILLESLPKVWFGFFFSPPERLSRVKESVSRKNFSFSSEFYRQFLC